MTPRQCASWAVLGYARHRGEMAEALAIAAMATGGKADAINRQIKEWSDA